jgi:hypothetical protein
MSLATACCKSSADFQSAVSQASSLQPIVRQKAPNFKANVLFGPSVLPIGNRRHSRLDAAARRPYPWKLPLGNTLTNRCSRRRKEADAQIRQNPPPHIGGWCCASETAIPSRQGIFRAGEARATSIFRSASVRSEQRSLREKELLPWYRYFGDTTLREPPCGEPLVIADLVNADVDTH